MMKFFRNPKALAALVLLAGFSFRPAYAFDSTAEADSADYQNTVTDVHLSTGRPVTALVSPREFRHLYLRGASF